MSGRRPCTPCERARLTKWAWCTTGTDGTTYCWEWVSNPTVFRRWAKERGLPAPTPSKAHRDDSTRWPEHEDMEDGHGQPGLQEGP